MCECEDAEDMTALFVVALDTVIFLDTIFQTRTRSPSFLSNPRHGNPPSLIPFNENPKIAHKNDMNQTPLLPPTFIMPSLCSLLTIGCGNANIAIPSGLGINPNSIR